MYLLGGVLVLLGLVGIYVRQSEESGILGLVGFLVAFFGMALLVGSAWFQLFVAPFFAVEAPGALDAEPAGMLAVGFVALVRGLFDFGLDLVRHSYTQSRGLPTSSRHTPPSRGVDQLPTHTLH